MPPNKPLPAAAQADLAAWVAAGARWPKSEIVEAADRGPDALGLRAAEGRVAARRPDRLGRGADRPADRGRASRPRGAARPAGRAVGTSSAGRSFDLIGLPPAPERVEAFVADERPDAFARLVDELLASPHYGERWGRYWLDLARYADTAGRQLRLSDPPGVPLSRLRHRRVQRRRPLRSVPPRAARRRHPGRRGPPRGLSPAGSSPPGSSPRRSGSARCKLEDIHQIIEDTLNTTGQVVLGLSLRCARCHDHKFDPITLARLLRPLRLLRRHEVPVRRGRGGPTAERFRAADPARSHQGLRGAARRVKRAGSRRSSPGSRPEARPRSVSATWR